jgi:3-methyladenine DNA glycosylase/8-oxoguanine DNA glycosylase
MNSPRGSVVGYDLWVDKFIGNVEKYAEREHREKERAREPVRAHRTVALIY